MHDLNRKVGVIAFILRINMKRVIAYIDGYNLYYGLLKGTPYKWLDLVSFVKWFLRPDQEIVGIKYFTAPIKTYPHDGDAVDRQKVYLQALSSMPLITIVQGFYAKNKTLAPDVIPYGRRGDRFIHRPPAWR